MPTGSFQQFVVGFSLLLVAVLTGIMMSWMGGQLIDGFYANQLNGQALVPTNVIAYAASPVYTGMLDGSIGPITYFVNLFYLLCYALPIMGAVLFFQGFVKYQSAEYYGSMFATGDDAGEGRRRRRRRRS